VKNSRQLRYALALGATTLVALALRVIAIDRLPPGLYHDEAQNGLDALRVLAGARPLFFEANNGREPLYIYSVAAIIAALGRSPGAIRLTSALWGTAFVPLAYLLSRELYNDRVGLWSAALAATTVWSLNLSRVGFRAVSMLPIAAAGLWCLVRALHRRRCALAVFAGALLGLTLYTYLAARLVLLIVVLLAVVGYRRGRRDFWWRGWLLLIVGYVFIAAPMIGYLGAHLAEATRRAAQVSILNPQINQGDLLGTLWRHIWRTLGLFFWRGDFIPRHNVPLRPVFDPLLGIAFCVGLMRIVRESWQRFEAQLCLLWLVVMLLPTVLAEGAPHMLRASGVLPVLFVFPAAGFDWLWGELGSQLRWRWGGRGALISGVLLSTIMGLRAYERHLHSQDVYYNFETGATELAVQVNRFLGTGWQGKGVHVRSMEPHPDREVFISRRFWDGWASIRYLCPDEPGLNIVANADEVALSVSSRTVQLFVWPFEDVAAYARALPVGRQLMVREGAWERGDLESEARQLYVVLESRPRPVDVEASEIASWDDAVTLRSAALTWDAPDRLSIDLLWEAKGRHTAADTVFTHLVCGSELLGQHDGPPALGYYAIAQWRPSDLILDRHEIRLSRPLSAENCELRVGLYRWQTLERAPITSGDGKDYVALPLDIRPKRYPLRQEYR